MNNLRIFFSSRKSWTLPYLIFSAVFVIIPLILILVYAFTDDAGHLTLENFCLFHRYRHPDNHRLYPAGLSGSLDTQPEQNELFADADPAVYPSHVGKHPDPYAGYRGSV